MLRDETGHATTAPLTLMVTRPDGVEFRKRRGAGRQSARRFRALASGPHRHRAAGALADGGLSRSQGDAGGPRRLRRRRFRAAAAQGGAHAARPRCSTPNGDFTIRENVRFLYGAPAAGLGGEGRSAHRQGARSVPAIRGLRLGPRQRNLQRDRGHAHGSRNRRPGRGPRHRQHRRSARRLDAAAGDHPRVRLRTGRAHHRQHGDAAGARRATSGWACARISTAIRSPKTRAPASRPSPSMPTGGASRARGLHYQLRARGHLLQLVSGQRRVEISNPPCKTRIVAGGSFDIGAANGRDAGADAAVGQLSPHRHRSGVGRVDQRTASGPAGRARPAGDRPDRVAVAADREKYRPGETAHIKIAPQFDGKALVIVAGDKLYSSQLVDTPKSGATVDIDVSADWGAGAYVLVTEYRPLSSAEEHAPVRAVGLVWLGVDNSARTLDRHHRRAAEDGAAHQRDHSRQRRRACQRRRGLRHARRGGRRHPPAHRFQDARSRALLFRQAPARRRHARRLRPPDPEGATRPWACVRTGGDNFGGRPLAVVPTQNGGAVLGPGEARQDGKANITFAVPDFNGELRLMAVVWSKDKMGSARTPAHRARSGGRRTRAAALPGAGRRGQRRAQPAQRRGPARHLHRGGHRLGRGRHAGRRARNAPHPDPARGPARAACRCRSRARCPASPPSR